MAFKLNDYVTYRTKNGKINMSGTIIGIAYGSHLVEWDEEPLFDHFYAGSNYTAVGRIHLPLNSWDSSQQRDNSKFDNNNRSIRKCSWIGYRSKCLYGEVAYVPSQVGDREDDI